MSYFFTIIVFFLGFISTYKAANGRQILSLHYLSRTKQEAVKPIVTQDLYNLRKNDLPLGDLASGSEHLDSLASSRCVSLPLSADRRSTSLLLSSPSSLSPAPDSAGPPPSNFHRTNATGSIFVSSAAVTHAVTQ